MTATGILVSRIAPLLPPNLQQILTLSSEKGLRPGCLFFQLKIMGLLYTKGHFLMHCASVMVGYLRVFRPSVFVAVNLLLTVL